jgi:hypothetical protein
VGGPGRGDLAGCRQDRFRGGCPGPVRSGFGGVKFKRSGTRSGHPPGEGVNPLPQGVNPLPEPCPGGVGTGSGRGGIGGWNDPPQTRSGRGLPPGTGSGSRFGGIPPDSVGTVQTRNSPRFPRDSLGNGRFGGEERTFDGEFLMLCFPAGLGQNGKQGKRGFREASRGGGYPPPRRGETALPRRGLPPSQEGVTPLPERVWRG